jgi:hypothetical protein
MGKGGHRGVKFTTCREMWEREVIEEVPLGIIITQYVIASCVVIMTPVYIEGRVCTYTGSSLWQYFSAFY